MFDDYLRARASRHFNHRLGKTPTRRMAVGLVQFRVRVDVGDHVGSAPLLLNAEYVLDPLDTVDCGSHRGSLCLVRRRRHLP